MQFTAILSLAALAVASPLLEERQSSCPQPGPFDTPAAFEANPAYSGAAYSGASFGFPQNPLSNYTVAFLNKQAAVSGAGTYLGYTTISTYNPAQCATICNNINGCGAFDIYFERDPAVSPSAACPNPASVTNINCAYWTGPITPAEATNSGQYRNNFQVVIAGSDAFNLIQN